MEDFHIEPMQIQTLNLVSASPGQRLSIPVFRFGAAAPDVAAPVVAAISDEPGAAGKPPLKAMIQAALHADEVPAMLVAQALRHKLAALDAAGQVIGEVVLVPYANPMGLGQQVLGQHQGRFDLRDGINFNRNVPDLSDSVNAALQGRLGEDAARNVALVREALRQAAAALSANHPAEDLKIQLLRLAVDADVVLDMHCDSQAALHLYALTPQADLAIELGTLMGARAILLATESGGSPFDEACSRPWLEVQLQHPDKPVPLACFSTTIELRGEADTGHEMAAADADAIIEFLRRRGLIAGAAAVLPPTLCEATPLSGSEPIVAPHAGVVVFRCEPGTRLNAGDVVADIVSVDTGEVTAVRALSSGVLYARIATRWATAGKRLGKVAGSTLARTGKLLSA